MVSLFIFFEKRNIFWKKIFPVKEKYISNIPFIGAYHSKGSKGSEESKKKVFHSFITLKTVIMG